MDRHLLSLVLESQEETETRVRSPAWKHWWWTKLCNQTRLGEKNVALWE